MPGQTLCWSVVDLQRFLSNPKRVSRWRWAIAAGKPFKYRREMQRESWAANPPGATDQSAVLAVL